MTRASGSTRASSRTPWRARRGDAVRAVDQCRSRTNFIARCRIRRRALRGRAFLCVAGRHPKRAVSRVCSAAAFRRDSSPRVRRVFFLLKTRCSLSFITRCTRAIAR
jgi:hypothetical protein